MLGRGAPKARVRVSLPDMLSDQGKRGRMLLAIVLTALALSPAAIWHTITTVWDVSASAFLLGLLIYFLRRLQCAPGLKQAMVTAVIAGVLALFNPACLIVYAAGAAWICIQQRKRPLSLVR